MEIAEFVGPTADAGGPYSGGTCLGGTAEITLDGSASAAGDALIVSWEWTETDLGHLGYGETLGYDYAPGSYTVTLTVTDSNGCTDTDDEAVEIAEFVGPTADAGPDKTALIGETVQFDGSGSCDPDGTIVAYEWDFGDGTLDSGEIVNHIYNVAVIYAVTLTVTDDDDLTGTDTAEITVQTPAEATGDLITTVEDFELPTGIEQSLTASQEAAINALERGNEEAAISQLNAFINYVEALQRAGKLTEEEADALIAAAQRIIDSIQ